MIQPGPAEQIGDPPAAGFASVLAARRQESQEVDLFADLRDQREHDRRGRAEQKQVEGSLHCFVSSAAETASIQRNDDQSCHGDEDEGQKMQHNPDRLRPELEAADEGDAMGHQRNDDQRTEDIADDERHAETHLQRQRHDRRFDGEEEECERRVDQRGDRRADIAEPRAAGQQVDVDAIGGRVIGDRQAGEEDQCADDQDGGGRVGEAVIDGDGAADRLERQKRNRADGGVGDTEARPAPRAFRGEAQRVVFERLVGDPLIVVAPDANDFLLRSHRARRSLMRWCQAACRYPPELASAIRLLARLSMSLSLRRLRQTAKNQAVCAAKKCTSTAGVHRSGSNPENHCQIRSLLRAICVGIYVNRRMLQCNNTSPA